MPPDRRYLLALRAAHKSEVKDVCQKCGPSLNRLKSSVARSSACRRRHWLFMSTRCVCLSGHAVSPPPAAGLPRPQSLHPPAGWVHLILDLLITLACQLNGAFLYVVWRIHSWSRNPPPEAAGTCQPAVRLHWCSKTDLEEIIFMSRFQDRRFIVVVLQGALRPMPPPSIHPSASGLLPTPSMTVQIPTAKVTHQNTAQESRFFQENGWNPECNCGVFLPQSPFQSSPQGAPRHGFLSHSQTSQRFYPHGK